MSGHFNGVWSMSWGFKRGFDKVLTKYHKSGEDENHRKIKDEVGSLKLLGILPKLIWYLFGM